MKKPEKAVYNTIYTVELEDGRFLESIPAQIWDYKDPETGLTTHYVDISPEVGSRPDWLHRYQKMHPNTFFNSEKELKGSMTREEFVAFKWEYIKTYLPKLKGHNRKAMGMQVTRGDVPKFKD